MPGPHDMTDLEFIVDYRMGWPHWPYLPLKKRTGETGLLFDASTAGFLFGEGLNMWKGGWEATDFKQVEPSKLVEDGWLVD